MKRLIPFFLFYVSCIALASEPTVVFQKNEGGYDTFRIPAVVKAANGDILAFAEGRKNTAGDTGEIDLVMKRSIDGGVTWSELQIVMKDGENTCGNPSPVLDVRNGRLILLSTWNKGCDGERDIRLGRATDSRRIFCQTSDDNGHTWTFAKEITSSAKRIGWTWYATGPCHALQLSDARHKGRIVVPCNHGVLSVDDKGVPVCKTASHVIYSDDGGESWSIGGCPNTGNESTVAQLRNGSILLNMREEVSGAPVLNLRISATSIDGGESFGTFRFDKDLPEPVCQGSIMNYTRNGRNSDILLFCNPSSKSRNNLTLKLSSDGGNSWVPVCVICSGPSAYSDILVLDNRDVGVLFENGISGCYERISFIRIPRKRIVGLVRG